MEELSKTLLISLLMLLLLQSIHRLLMYDYIRISTSGGSLELAVVVDGVSRHDIVVSNGGGGGGREGEEMFSLMTLEVK